MRDFQKWIGGRRARNLICAGRAVEIEPGRLPRSDAASQAVVAAAPSVSGFSSSRLLPLVSGNMVSVTMAPSTLTVAAAASTATRKV